MDAAFYTLSHHAQVSTGGQYIAWDGERHLQLSELCDEGVLEACHDLWLEFEVDLSL
jgi:hypothetical protein